MKRLKFVVLGIFLSAGCVYSQSVSSGNAPGYVASARSGSVELKRARYDGPEGEKLWADQLAKGGLRTHNLAIVKGVHGNALMRTKGVWKVVEIGTALGEGDELQTSDESCADLFLGENGPVVRALKESNIALVRLDLQEVGSEKIVDTMIEVREGAIRGSVKKMAAASSYLVRTRSGVIKVRGTEFSANADGDVSLDPGVALVYTDGKSTEAKENFAISAGAAPANQSNSITKEAEPRKPEVATIASAVETRVSKPEALASETKVVAASTAIARIEPPISGVEALRAELKPETNAVDSHTYETVNDGNDFEVTVGQGKPTAMTSVPATPRPAPQKHRTVSLRHTAPSFEMQRLDNIRLQPVP